MVRQVLAEGCENRCGRLPSVGNAMEACSCSQKGSGWLRALEGAGGGGGGTSPPFNAPLGRRVVAHLLSSIAIEKDAGKKAAIL